MIYDRPFRQTTLSTFTSHKDGSSVILAEDEEERIGSYLFPDIAQSYACLPLSICPDVSPAPRLPSSSAR